MKHSARKLLALVGAAATGSALAAPSVEIKNVQQQYPWTNTVDITYSVQGVKTHQVDKILLTNETYFVAFEAKDADGNAIPDTSGRTIITNALVNGNNEAAVAQWHPALGQQLTDCKITPSVFRGEENAYLVINLETNAEGTCDWWFEPMSTQEASNKRYNTAEYKTTKLVLRRVAKGTHTIGPVWYENKSLTTANMDISITNDYYYGVFPATVAQYARIMGLETGLTSGLPVNQMSHSGLRGGASVNAEPGDGALKTLSDRTGLAIDLPTLAMSFVAAAAGVTTTYISGDTYTQLGDYGHFGSSRKTVGSYLPNNWGIYDVIGNLWETQRDVLVTTANQAKALKAGLTPMTTGSATYVSEVSCCFNNAKSGQYTRLFSFSATTKTNAATNHGFRFSAIVPADAENAEEDGAGAGNADGDGE